MVGAEDDEQPRGPAQDPNREQIRQLVHRRRIGESIADATQIESLPVPEQLQAQDHKQDIGLKRTYAYWLLGAVIGQLFAANAVFVAYAWAGKHWDLDAVVIDVWLAATLVQVIGVVTIVTRYLFPRRDIGTAASAA
jgi:hypothetical protein